MTRKEFNKFVKVFVDSNIPPEKRYVLVSAQVHKLYKKDPENFMQNVCDAVFKDGKTIMIHKPDVVL